MDAVYNRKNGDKHIEQFIDQWYTTNAIQHNMLVNIIGWDRASTLSAKLNIWYGKVARDDEASRRHGHVMMFVIILNIPQILNTEQNQFLR